jgi:hypothetical protein
VLAAVLLQSIVLQFTKQTGAWAAFYSGFSCYNKTRSMYKPVTRATRDYECAGRRTIATNIFGDYKANGRMRCAPTWAAFYSGFSCCNKTRSISKPVTRATRDYEYAGRRTIATNVFGDYKANGRMRCAPTWSCSVYGFPFLIKGVLFTNPLARATRDY